MSYFVEKIYAFECDAPGCDAMTDVEPGAAGRNSPLRYALRDLRREHDWTIRDGKHYCPRHAPAGAA